MFALFLLGLSLAPDQVPALHFPTDPCYPNTPYAAFPPAPTGWRDTDRQSEQEQNHNPLSPQDIYGVSILSVPPESSSHTMIAGSSSSLSVESYTQFGLEGNYAESTSLPCGPVENTTENVMATQGQITTTQEASHERKVQRKNEKDKARKKVTDRMRKKEQDKARKREQDKARKWVDRDNDEQDYGEICDLLNIELKPKNKLARRSECLCIHPRLRY
jgi:hypothetical protein